MSNTQQDHEYQQEEDADDHVQLSEFELEFEKRYKKFGEEFTGYINQHDLFNMFVDLTSHCFEFRVENPRKFMMQYLKNAPNFNEKEISSEQQQDENEALECMKEDRGLTPDKDPKAFVPQQDVGTMTEEQAEKAEAIELKDSATITEDWCGIVSDTENQEAVANVSDGVRRFQNIRSINKKQKYKVGVFEYNINSREKRVIKPKTRLNMTTSPNYESKTFPALKYNPKLSNGFRSKSDIFKSASKRMKKRVDDGAKAGPAEENSGDDGSFNGFDESSILQSVELTNSVNKFRPFDDSQC